MHGEEAVGSACVATLNRMTNGTILLADLVADALGKLAGAVSRLASPAQPAPASVFAESAQWSDRWIDQW